MTGKISRITGSLLAAGAMLLPGLALAQEAAANTDNTVIMGQPHPGETGLQPAATPIMESIHTFHDGILLWTAVLIALLVAVLLLVVIFRFDAKRNPTPSRTTHNTLVEVIWTVVPILILVVIAIPSFAVLTDQLTIPDGARKYLGANIFSFGEVQVPAPGLTIKATGQQWYWDYEYVDQGKTISSNILQEDGPDGRKAMKPNQPRLLAVDNELVVPVNTTVRVQVTSDPTGVIHAFAVPSFGVIVDAVPGKLNETWFNVEKVGIYYGQCRELCGKDHAFMPIAVRVVSQDDFARWMDALKAGSVATANATLPPIT